MNVIYQCTRIGNLRYNAWQKLRINIHTYIYIGIKQMVYIKKVIGWVKFSTPYSIPVLYKLKLDQPMWRKRNIGRMITSYYSVVFTFFQYLFYFILLHFTISSNYISSHRNIHTIVVFIQEVERTETLLLHLICPW